MTNTKSAIKNVAKKGPIKAFIINVSSFLITLLNITFCAKSDKFTALHVLLRTTDFISG